MAICPRLKAVIKSACNFGQFCPKSAESNRFIWSVNFNVPFGFVQLYWVTLCLSKGVFGFIWNFVTGHESELCILLHFQKMHVASSCNVCYVVIPFVKLTFPFINSSVTKIFYHLLFRDKETTHDVLFMIYMDNKKIYWIDRYLPCKLL